jgi:hypothetical protein
VTRRRRGRPDLFTGRRGRHAQPVHRFPLLSHFHTLACFPFAYLSVAIGSLSLLSLALALKFHALLLCALAVLPLAILALALEIHPLMLDTLAVLPLAIHAVMVLAGTVRSLAVLPFSLHAVSILALAIFAFAVFALAVVLVVPPGLIAIVIVVAVCPRGQRGAKSEQDSRGRNPVSHCALLMCLLYRRRRPRFNSILLVLAAAINAAS